MGENVLEKIQNFVIVQNMQKLDFMIISTYFTYQLLFQFLIATVLLSPMSLNEVA